MSAILFGSISTLADTSELQRQAFNEAFAEHGLDWRWDRDDYRSMLERSGGSARIAEYARSRGEDVDADAVHATKSATFQRLLTEDAPAPRPGVLETVQAARTAGVGVGLVTTTSPENVAALFDALGPELGRDAFDVVVDSSQVAEPKPDPAAYAFALSRIGESAGSSVAVEDNVGGVDAAVADGLRCVAFPNANTAGHDFGSADRVVDHIDPDELLGLVTR